MDKQQHLRQAEQDNIFKAISDYDAKLQRAFANAQNPKPIKWIRATDRWTISRDG